MGLLRNRRYHPSQSPLPPAGGQARGEANLFDKFSDGYVIYLDHEETEFLRSKTPKVDNGNQPVENFDRFKTMKHSTVKPKAFTDKGLYMLATILKSPQATETTLAIIETYA